MNKTEAINTENQLPITPKEAPQKSSTCGKIGKIFWVALGSMITFNLADRGLSRTLALETLTHGTSPQGYLSISINGADPSFGGSETGSSVSIGNQFHVINSKNFFHVFKDSEFPDEHLINFLEGQLATKLHAVGAGMASFGYQKKDDFEYQNIAKGAVGGILGLLTPTLKFRFKPEEILDCDPQITKEWIFPEDCNWQDPCYDEYHNEITHDNICLFENDPDYKGSAYRTHNKISPWQLGITGTLTEGIDSKTPERMINRPVKVLSGILLIVLAVDIAKETLNFARAEKKQQEKPDKRSCTQTCVHITKVVARGYYWTTAAVLGTVLATT